MIYHGVNAGTCLATSADDGLILIIDTQIKRYGGRLGHRDSRIGEKSWRFRSSSDRGTVRGSDGHN